MIIEYKGMRPDVRQAAYVAENATVSGDVHLGKDSSVWFGAVIRAEVAPITVGDESNIQDLAMLHSYFDAPVNIGKRVTVGHSAIVHGATIEDDVIVGMGAIVMDYSVVGEGSIIAAGALVKQHQVIPPYSLVAGVPGVIKKTLTPGQRPQEGNAEMYIEDAYEYAKSPVIG
ncbi:gamma carbonic anhydrase family protein [Slackia heliotrinireducens]|uniref:gamma carbonic anhydrase family protein n=1 Tax=Slackia heliotrinireducens TaxID=84110 RepID=UPI003315F01B